MNNKNQNKNQNQMQNAQKTGNPRDVEFFNDQIGENASEEFRSENYANALTNKVNTKGLK